MTLHSTWIFALCSDMKLWTRRNSRLTVLAELCSVFKFDDSERQHNAKGSRLEVRLAWLLPRVFEELSMFFQETCSSPKLATVLRERKIGTSYLEHGLDGKVNVSTWIGFIVLCLSKCLSGMTNDEKPIFNNVNGPKTSVFTSLLRLRLSSSQFYNRLRFWF